MKNFLFSLSFRGSFILSIIFGLIYQFTFFDNGESIQQEIDSLKATEESTLQENERIKKENAIFQELLRNQKQLGEQFERFVSYIPEQDTASSYTKLLSSQAKLSNVDILSLDRQDEIVSKDGLYTTLPFKIQVRGTYSNITLFLSYLTKVNRIVNIGSFQVSAVNNPKNKKEKIATFTSVISTYRYNSEEEKKEDKKEKKGA